MKSKIGIVFMVAGAMLILGALGLFLYNQNQQINAAAASREAIPKVVDAIRQRREDPENQPEPVEQELQNKIMSVVQIDGYGYIGFLGIPALELELPVMSDWSYPQLQIAPCRYSGGMYSDDLVLMAHNYPKHFGRIGYLHTGDAVTFTDMDGVTVEYEVVAFENLGAMDVEGMTSGAYDLTLFTCTYGGQSRFAVRCDRME